MTHEAPSPESLLEHREWLRAIARSLVRDENAVDDVEQRTWLTVLRNRRPVTSARGWLRRVVRSAAVDEYRSESRRHAREEGAARTEAMPPTDHLVMEVEAQRAVAQAVAGLPEPYRTTVLLRYIEELSVRDVAARMDVPVKTVETRLRRALALLREALDREFGDRRAWCLVLLPLARDKAPIPIGAATAGALAMAAKTKAVAAVAALVLLAGGVTWVAVSVTADPSSPAPDTASPGAGASAPRESPTGPRFAVTGRVRSRLGGRPLAGAEVTLGKGTRNATTSADDGTFRIDDAAAGTLRIGALRFRASSVEVTPPASADDVVDVGDVWLDGSATLLVEVTGPDGAKVPNADVTLVRRRHSGEIATTHSYLRATAAPDSIVTRVGAARSGADGVARFEAIAPGLHEAVVRADGFAQASNAWMELPAQREETTFAVRLARAHRVSGRVVTATGEPASGRLVDADAKSWDDRGFARTDVDGRFVLDSVPAGDVALRAGRARGTNLVLAVIRVPEVSEVELRLPPMGAIAGVVSLADGTPVSDAEVGVETSVASSKTTDTFARTDAQGRWRIDEIPAGWLSRFEVRHPGLYHVGPRLESNDLHDRRNGSDTGIDPRVPANGELRLDATMAKGARLHGRVTGPDGAVAGAWVSLHLKPTRAGQEWETAVTDADGRYEFDYLPPGPAAAVPRHSVYVHPDSPKELGTALGAGKLPASLTFDLPEGGDVERDFTLAAGTRVAGRVTGPSGDPVTGAIVRIDATSNGAPPMPVATTDAAGAFVMDAAAGIGTTKLRAEAPGLAQVNVPDVELTPSGRVEGVEVRMAAAPRVTGRVLDADGSAVAGARVSLTRRGSSPVAVWTGATGAYEAAVPWLDGKLTLAASHDGGGKGSVDVELTAGGASADLRLTATSDVTGRVTDEEGRPLAGATVCTLDASKGLHWYLGEVMKGWGYEEVFRTSTDTDGRFRVALPDGAWAVIVRRDGYVDEAAPVTAPCRTELKMAMGAAATLTGTLRGDDGHPLAGTVVVLEPGGDVPLPKTSMIGGGAASYLTPAEYRFLRHTDPSGAFRFPCIPEGQYTLVAVLPTGDRQKPREVRFGPLRPSGGPHDLSVAMPLASALAGRIVDAGSVAFSDAQIRITVIEERGSDPWQQKRSNAVAAADGTFRIENLTAPSYTLQVFVSADPALAVSPPNTTVYRRSLRRAFHGLRPPRTDLVLEMAELPHLRGRLVDDAAAPLRGWTVQAVPADATMLTSNALTRDDGTFDLRDVEDGDYRLEVRLADQPARRVVLSRPARGGMDLGDVVATLEARIRGRVVDAKGVAVADAEVQVWPLRGGSQQKCRTGADGTFEATGLDPDLLYKAGLVGANGRPAWESNVAGEGVRPGTTDLRLVRE